MRVGIIALLHESNTFIRRQTTMADFQADLLLEGEAIRDQLVHSHHEVAGFFAGLADAGLEAAPIFAARALPYGVIAAAAYQELVDRMMAAVDRTGQVDGLLVAPHGATVSETIPDVDGHWLTLLRQRFGPETPIISTLDPHANLSRQMVEAANAITAYRTNPHLDQKDRGKEAAALMARTLRGEIRPTQAASFPPLAINIERQRTAQPPCLPLYQLAEDIRRRPGVLSASVILGFPFADVAEVGSSLLVVTNDDAELAQRQVNELAGYLWSRRQEFVGQYVSPEEALDSAANLTGSICLLDMGDNVGGGSPGDGTILAQAIHDRQLAESFVCLCDPEAVRQAAAAGPGAMVNLSVGGKSDDLHGSPVTSPFTVVSLHEGRFEEPNPRHGGFTSFDQGQTAIVRTPYGLTVMLTSRRMAPFSLGQITSCGLEPRSFRYIVAKGVQAPVAAYEEVCQHFLRVDTPGVTSANMQRLPYRHRRRPMFPFEVETAWRPA